ncbi:MAG: pyrroline-5-carboxylate reductase [Candidatus Lightella neohaematopini]|nr:pyrroline-5-carboxylate reductase [Candidatus Lightella neohaematopini]MCV2528772.1 pyrroline-5-carboxylate reductase [Candidatus Lightella neohaematopini]
MKEKKINIIGAGNMSYAIVSGLINSNYKKDLITVCAPSINNKNNIIKSFGIKNSNINTHYSDQADIIILSVKPQSITSVCQDLNKINLSKKIIISLLAGININILTNLLKQDNINIIRIMPNIAITTNHGIIAMYVMSKINISDINFIKDLFSRMGMVYQLDKESDIDIFTIIVGSSPAYFLFFMEAMQKKIESMGINQCDAYNIILETINGITYLSRHWGNTFNKLRKLISSKKGITESAISIFKKENLSLIIANAIDVSMNRIKDLKNLKT